VESCDLSSIYIHAPLYMAQLYKLSLKTLNSLNSRHWTLDTTQLHGDGGAGGTVFTVSPWDRSHHGERKYANDRQMSSLLRHPPASSSTRVNRDAEPQPAGWRNTGLELNLALIVCARTGGEVC
jgi:hypothetical protein